MSDRERDRDLRLAGKLGELPPPALPPGLAARIVQNATRLPQHHDEPVAPVQEPAVIALPPRHRRRWLPHALGAAMAASIVAAFLWQQDRADPAPHAASGQVAKQAAAPPLAPVEQVEPADAAPAAPLDGERLVRSRVTAPKPHEGKDAGPASASGSASPGRQPDAPADIAPHKDPTPQLANDQAPAGKTAEPVEQAFVGPPADDERGAPILQSEPASGLGISGAGSAAPGAFPAPPPPRQSRGAGPMPRF